MTASHQSILNELYEIDPSLREHEAELLPLVQKLLANDPAQKPSPAFVKKLRKELSTRMNAMENGAVEHKVSYASPSGFFNRFAFALAGATAAVVIAVPVTLNYSKQHSLVPPASPEAGDESPMAKTDGYAVNDQATGMTAPSPTATNPVAGMGYARTQSGGGGAGGGGMGMDGKMSAVSSLLAPWNPVKYRLEGDLPDLAQGDVEVLTRRSAPLTVAFATIAKSFDIKSIDLSSFDNTSIDNVTVTQRKSFGYTINISMADGSVSINQAWEFWPHPENNCTDEACYRNLQPTLSDVLADADLLKISNAFLAEHDIDLSSYGDPIVDKAWRDQYEAVEDKRYAYVPDSIRVVYPLVVDGKTVTEAGGGPAGVSVQVSIKHKRVSDVWGLMTYQFDRKDHPAVSERADVEKFLGMSGSQTPDAPTIALKNPTIGFVRLYDYQNGVNTELFVPALIFQITDVPAGTYYYQTTVAVPLAKDLLDQAQPPIMIDPVPMPRPMDGGGPAVDVPAQEPLMMEKAAQ